MAERRLHFLENGKTEVWTWQVSCYSVHIRDPARNSYSLSVRDINPNMYDADKWIWHPADVKAHIIDLFMPKYRAFLKSKKPRKKEARDRFCARCRTRLPQRT